MESIHIQNNAHDIDSSVHAYNQNWITKILTHEEPLHGVFQRFLSTGPIALLPLWGRYSYLVWFGPNYYVDELQSLSSSELIKEINNWFYRPSDYNYGNFFSSFTNESINASSFEKPSFAMHDEQSSQFKLSVDIVESISASRFASKRVALVGEAACKLHPLTGQGFNLNMTAAATLANWIIEQMRSGGDIGSYEHWLKKYADSAKRNELESTAIIEAFKNGYNNSLYGSESLGSFLSFIRNVGIDLINVNPLAKYNFVFFAAGCTSHPTSYEWKKDN